MLPGVQGREHIQRGRQIHPDQVRELEQAQTDQGDLPALHVCHRHHQHTVRVRCSHRRHRQEESAGVRTLLAYTTLPLPRPHNHSYADTTTTHMTPHHGTWNPFWLDTPPPKPRPPSPHLSTMTTTWVVAASVVTMMYVLCVSI